MTRTDAMTQTARKLRNNMTDAEKILWRVLRNRQLGVRFRRQVPVGKYIVDFACFSPRIVVEVDGSQHLDSAGDSIRDLWLQSQGFKVLRFWNDAVLNNMNSVVIAIQNELE